jgi:hypothetical protein
LLSIREWMLGQNISARTAKRIHRYTCDAQSDHPAWNGTTSVLAMSEM